MEGDRKELDRKCDALCHTKLPIVLYTNVDAVRDQLVTVVSRMLTVLGHMVLAIVLLFRPLKKKLMMATMTSTIQVLSITDR